MMVAPMSGTITQVNKEVGEMALGSAFSQDIIMANDILLDIARENPQTVAELVERPGFGKWRIEHYGKEIVEELQEAVKERKCLICEENFTHDELIILCPHCKIRIHLKDLQKDNSGNTVCPKCEKEINLL